MVSIRKKIAYMDYDTAMKVLLEAVYFKRPTTRHTNPDVKVVKVEIRYKVKR